MTWLHNTTNRLKIDFRSTDLINIRITHNDSVDVIQCRTGITKVIPVVFDERSIIKIENLTQGTPCIIDRIVLNYLDITGIMFQYTETFEKATMNKIGDFVLDVYSPDICIMNLDLSLNWYSKNLHKFRDGAINCVS